MKLKFKDIVLSILIMAIGASDGIAQGTIKGRVTDLLGNPIGKAVVEVTPDDADMISKETDASGEYYVKDLPQGYVTVTYKFPGFRNQESRIYVNSKEEKVIDVGLEVGLIMPLPVQTIMGNVRDQNDQAVPEASVSLVNSFNQRIKLSVRTNSKGNYTVETDLPGRYILLISKPGFEIDVATFALVPTDKARVVTRDVVLRTID